MGSRFKFDLDFDDPRNSGDAPPAPSFSADELKAARDVAHAEGLAAGRGEAMASVERHMADALVQIAEQLKAAADERQQALARLEHNAIDLCTTLLRKLFPEMQRRHGPDEIAAMVAESLRRMVDEPRVVVRLNNGLLDGLQERIDAAARTAGFAGKVVLIGDEMVAAGDCRIEWADGGAERLGNRLWAEIDAAVARMVERASVATGSAAMAEEAPRAPETGLPVTDAAA